MSIRQISIFLENRCGRLREITDVLAKAGINIRAISLADTSDFGILRIIVNKPDEAMACLREARFTISETEVLAVEVEDRPGGLAKIVALFASAGIGVEYMYGFVEKSGEHALMIFRVEGIDIAVDVLREKGVRLLTGSEVYAL